MAYPFHLLKPECEALGRRPSASRKGLTPRRQQFVFKKKNTQMTVAHSIFTLGGQVQLFWTAFDLPVTVVPLKVAL